MSFETSLTWLIVLKALLRSKKQAPTMQLESTLRLISSTNVIAANSVDLFFYAGDPYHVETSPLVFSSNQWTGFLMIRTSVMKVLTGSLWKTNFPSLILLWTIILSGCLFLLLQHPTMQLSCGMLFFLFLG